MRHASVLFILIAAAACGDPAKKLIENNAALLDATYAGFARIGADVAKQPPLTADRFDLPPGTKLMFGAANPADLNAGVVYPAMLREPCETGDELHWAGEEKRPPSDTQILVRPADHTDLWLTDASCLHRKGTGPYGGEPRGEDGVRRTLE